MKNTMSAAGSMLGLFLFASCLSAPRAEASEVFAPPYNTLTQTMPDGVVMTADHYLTSASEAQGPRPVVLCLHMTHSSRGEYRDIAPRLSDLGYHALAADLRCGGDGENYDRATGRRWGTPNATAASAKAVYGHDAGYVESYPDVDFAVQWAKALHPGSKVILLGSSFSASFVVKYMDEHPGAVAGGVSYSPGEWIPGWSIAAHAAGVQQPLLISSGQSPLEHSQATPIAQAVPSPLLQWVLPGPELTSDHGSRALIIPDIAHRERHWVVLQEFLATL